MDNKRLKFQKGDLLAILLVTLCAALVFALFLPDGEGEAAYAQIYCDGVLVRTVDLSTDQEFAVTATYVNQVCVKDGRVAIIQSDCPGGDCVHSGWTDTPGRSLVCLPNGVEIRVVAEDADVDFVVR